MRSNLSDFFEYKREVLSEYCIKKYVSAEDEQEYLQMFEELDKQTKRRYGRNLVSVIMFHGDVESYRALPKRLNIYRGYHEAVKREGISWSLSKTVAQWFAHNCWLRDIKDVPPSVVQGTCSLKDILAYTNDCGEQEIIINPRKVKGIKNIAIDEPTNVRAIAEPLEDILKSNR